MRDIVIIGLVVIMLIIVVLMIIGIINANRNKQNRRVAYSILEDIMIDIKAELIPIVIDFASGIDIEEFQNPDNDRTKIYGDILNTISDYIYNKCSEEIKVFIDKYKDKKIIYTLLNSLLDDDVIGDLALEIKGDPKLNDMFTELYNQCFDEVIDQIEADDAKLVEEHEAYETAPIKDETQEQHNQSIEEYAKAHLEEKIQEIENNNEELKESGIINTVPVRDLRALAPLIDDDNIIPPSDEEPDVLTDDDVYEVVEYLDGNITDKTLSAIDEAGE